MSHIESHSDEHIIDRMSPRNEVRPPLPAGHPVSWGAITRGTVLDGVPWPGAPVTGAAPRADEITLGEPRRAPHAAAVELRGDRSEPALACTQP